MNSKSTIDNAALHQEVIHSVLAERSSSLTVLINLARADEVRLWAEMGYPSLFEYLICELKYSESEAFRRIHAMRLLNEIPELAYQLKNGEMTLTTLAQAERFFR